MTRFEHSIARNQERTGANLYGHTSHSHFSELAGPRPLCRVVEIVSKPCETTDFVLAVRGPCMSSGLPINPGEAIAIERTARLAGSTDWSLR